MIKSTFITYQTQKALKKRESKDVPPYSDSQKIGLIFTRTEGQPVDDIVHEFQKRIEKDNKEVQALALTSEKSLADSASSFYAVPSFYAKEISWLGSIQSDDINHFIDQPFDFLFHLDTSSNHYIDMILAASHAKCRVGLWNNSREQFYDLMISPTNDNEDIESLIEHMYHYVIKIQY